MPLAVEPASRMLSTWVSIWVPDATAFAIVLTELLAADVVVEAFCFCKQIVVLGIIALSECHIDFSLANVADKSMASLPAAQLMDHSTNSPHDRRYHLTHL